MEGSTVTRANWRAGTARNKTVCVLIAVILIIGTLSAPAMAAEDAALSDERWPTGSYMSDFGDMAGRRLYVYGIIDSKNEHKEGISDADLVLNSSEPASRLDAAHMLYGIFGEKAQTAHPFSDVPEEYADAVNWMYDAGITKGVTEELYGTGEISQKHFLLMLSRLLGWGTENPDEAAAIAFRKELIPDRSFQNTFTSGDMYRIGCVLLDTYHPERCAVQREKMSSPGKMSLRADGYQDAVEKIREAAAFLPNRIEVTFTESCSDDELETFSRHFDWFNGDQQLPIIGMLDRCYMVPYSMNRVSDRVFTLWMNNYAQGFVACISRSGWLRVFKDENYRQEILRFMDEKVEPLRKYTTAYERAAQAHDLLCRLAAYDYEEYYGIIRGDSVRHLESHDILGFISRRKIVCDGYANVYHWILMCLDIESYSVFGKADDAGHAWNKVLIDGIWYNVYSCWDDTGSNARRYFLRGDNWMTSHRHSFTDSFSTTAFASPKDYT